MIYRLKRSGLTLWQLVREPRVISVAYFFVYFSLFIGGLTALIDPPRTVEGAIGTFSMMTLAGMLAFGGLLGAPAALVGIWWAERVAVLSVAMSALIYGGIVVVLHALGDGNRLLQLSFVVAVLLMQLVRWHRIKERPYDPDRHF